MALLKKRDHGSYLLIVDLYGGENTSYIERTKRPGIEACYIALAVDIFPSRVSHSEGLASDAKSTQGVDIVK